MNLDRLNDKQREAVLTTEGPVLIIAGAGSGKTSTMTSRIAYLMEQGVSQYNILAVTFTNKAAREMRTRIEDMVGNCNDMWILTFHAMCLRFLHVFYDRVGYKKGFVIYDTTDQKSLVKNIVKELNYNDKEFTPNYVLSIISNCKEKAILPKDYMLTVENNQKTEAIYRIYSTYQNRLRENNAMDFDDLLLNAFILLRDNEDVRRKYQERFKYIMVDEYQDTNHIQYRITSMLAEEHSNICVVGDDDQCIYQWRGADIRNILDFEKDFPNTKLIKLEQNYRSVGNILNAAHSVIENNRGRKPKKLWTDKEDGEKIKYFRAGSDKDEAYYVARGIEKERDSGIPYKEMAILYRTNAQSRLFEAALSSRNIPYRVLSGLRYYDRKEIKDMMSYMRLVANPMDNMALERIINEPKRSVGPKSFEKIKAYANSIGKSVFEALQDPIGIGSLQSKAQSPVRSLIELISQCRENRYNMTTAEIYDRLLVGTGYLQSLEADNSVESEGRIENLMEFKSVIFDFEKESDLGRFSDDSQENSDEEAVSPIEQFMEKLTLMAEVDNHDESQDAVVMMTMHSSKGLEFDVVFLPGMEEGLFPSVRSMDSIDGMEEERRLCYVGMTRAKKKLYLSSAEYRVRFGSGDYMAESQFLKEIDRDLLEGDFLFGSKRKASERFSNMDGFREEPFRPYGNSRSGYDSSYGEGGRSSFSKGGSFSDATPFDAIKKSIEKSKAVGSRAVSLSGGDEFKAGDKVSHKKFGMGVVISSDNGKVKVDFEIGTKTLAASAGVLKKI